MAQMFPEHMSPETKSPAERRLFDAFRDQLDADYVVFHHVNWLGKDPRGRARDGEADFVIAHPERGILVVEAKGGEIRYDRGEQTWSRRSLDGTWEPLKRNPIEQAVVSKHHLLQELRKMPKLEKVRLIGGHAVAFPDIALPADWDELELARKLVLDCTGMRDVARWVQGALAHWQMGVPKRAVSANVLRDALVNLLGKTIELEAPLWTRFNEERQEIIRLTGEQYRVLDLLNPRRRAKICGCAGSGKTMLAAEKARRLGERFDVLLTCYNRALARSLKRQFEENPHVTVMGFHEICGHFAQQANIPLKDTDDDDYYLRRLPAALELALHTVAERYDAIIVDEGQDLQPAWWDLLVQLLRDPQQGILYIFYDDNQCLYQHALEFPIGDEAFPLTINCRNTQNIQRAVVQFYRSDEIPKVRGPMGAPIEYIWYDAQPDLGRCLDALLVRLTQQENIPVEEIAVLTPSYRSIQRWLEMPHHGPALSYNYPPSAGTVYGTTIFAFKGLERSIVVLTEVDSLWLSNWAQVNLDELLYVGCSRAINYLIVLLNRQGNPKVHELFAKAGLRYETTNKR